MSALYDPQSVQNYHTEYLKLIKYYMNAKRPSSFVRYFNIDRERSTYDEKLQATYDLYSNSDIHFNIYDFTPLYYISPIVNASSDVQDLTGQMMDAQTTITLYTIDRPQISDLVMFYGPIASGEIFRVRNFRTPVNAIHSEPKLNWFELDLEYAPIKTPENLRYSTHYVYDLSSEVYITMKEYRELTERVERCEKILSELKEFYNGYHDLYELDNLVPLVVNEVIIKFKKQYSIKYKRILDNYYLPYGYKDLFNREMFYNDLIDFPFKEGNYKYGMYNLSTKEIEQYTWSITYNKQNNIFDKMLFLAYQLFKEIQV
jgi:hypothetical protein